MYESNDGVATGVRAYVSEGKGGRAQEGVRGERKGERNGEKQGRNVGVDTRRAAYPAMSQPLVSCLSTSLKNKRQPRPATATTTTRTTTFAHFMLIALRLSLRTLYRVLRPADSSIPAIQWKQCLHGGNLLPAIEDPSMSEREWGNLVKTL